MTEYLVYIESSGDPITAKSPVAHVPALPGASVRGETIEEAKEKVREAIESYLHLLREAGEPVPRVSGGIHLTFEETEKTTFHTDYSALGADEIDMLLRWLAISREELVELVKGLPEEALDWQPDDSTPSIHDILFRIAEADLWYTDRLKQWPETALFRLAAARGVALERLRALPKDKWAEITVYGSEKWTPRKVIRRMLEFERENIHQIKTLLAARGSD